jgi:hypothetical protein
MVNVPYETAIDLVAKKLDRINKADEALFPEPIKAVVLGGYALVGLGREYGRELDRDTLDIDLYSTDAKLLVSTGDVALGPTGAKLQLTDNFHAELFDWISGMDNKNDLQNRLIEGMNKKTFVKLTDDSIKCELYLPPVDLFVANKLFAYRNQTTRDKDLKDVSTIVGIVREVYPDALTDIEETVKSYKLTSEYELAIGSY